MVKLWTPPAGWRDRTVAVMASGPSMNQRAADAVRAAGLPAIVVNNTFRLAPWADILYAADPEWWHLTPDARAFSGVKVSISPVSGTQRVEGSGVDGIDLHPGYVRTGNNSGYQALQLALQAGARRILLLGYDMTGTHWHGPHIAGLRNTTDETFRRWIAHYSSAAPMIAALGVEVVNCSLQSALTCFRKADLAAELGVNHADDDRSCGKAAS